MSHLVEWLSVEVSGHILLHTNCYIKPIFVFLRTNQYCSQFTILFQRSPLVLQHAQFVFAPPSPLTEETLPDKALSHLEKLAMRDQMGLRFLTNPNLS